MNKCEIYVCMCIYWVPRLTEISLELTEISPVCGKLGIGNLGCYRLAFLEITLQFTFIVFLELKQMSTNAYFFHLSADFILSFYLWCVLGCFWVNLWTDPSTGWLFCHFLGVRIKAWTYVDAIKWNLYTVQIKTVSFKFNDGAEPWRIQDSGQRQYS
jgi:hypothetical protein